MYVLDASNVFDCINQWLLFNKKHKRNVDIVLLRLLIYRYCNQQCCVKWGSTLCYTLSNAVQAGGGDTMSLILFNVYMDIYSIVLNNSSIVCHINGVLCNHLMYADAVHYCALYKLLAVDICVVFAKDTTIIFNSTKSKYMCFKPKSLPNLAVPDLYLNDKVFTCISKSKYLRFFL